MMEELGLYLIFPKDTQSLALAIAAPDESIAKQLFSLERQQEFADLQSVDLGEGLMKLGYSVDVKRVGVFH